MISDIEELRIALGEEAWVSGPTYCTMSRVLAGYLARYPGGVRHGYLDSPGSPGGGPAPAGEFFPDIEPTTLRDGLAATVWLGKEITQEGPRL